MLQRFLPLLLMTFFICLFIVLMQFLWKSIDDLVGKGLEVSVIAELFFYAALTMVPTALPLAVLLASLMVFGNLGENFELTAMKASGISLFRIMKPLTVLMIFIAVGAFFFQNNVLPLAQTKMWTMLFSVRQKSPEVEIPTKSFYDQIPNMNLYVDSKNPESGMLHGMIIYDLSQGMDNPRVILSDSGQFNFTQDKTRLFLHLFQGEMFENMRSTAALGGTTGFMPFRREHFTDKQIYFPFDANFNRVDEQGLRSQYIGQNVSQLMHSIDSLKAEVDSIGNEYAHELLQTPYFNITPQVTEMVDGKVERVPRREVKIAQPLNLDSMFYDPGNARSYVEQALSKAQRQQQEYYYRASLLVDQAKLMRRHDIEMQRKFTLSVACIIFFFIGAPLGAIIKKGGLGTPLVISVLLFIVYFIIDNMGYKMARDGKLPVWEGIWLSTAALLPLGVFFTYKAVGDSAVFNADAYRNFFRRLIGRSTPRSLSVKEVRMTEVETEEALALLRPFQDLLAAEQLRLSKVPAVARRFMPLSPQVTADLNILVDYLSNSPDIHIINLLNQYPFNPGTRSLGKMLDVTQKIIARIAPETAPEPDTTPAYGH